MTNREHEKIDQDFMVGGQVCSKLFYAVDGIYPYLTHLLGTASDPITKLDSRFAMDQEAARKDVEQGFGVLRLKFLILSNPIDLRHWDDI